MLENIQLYLRYYKNKKLKIAFSFLLSFIQALSLIPIAVLIQRVFDRALPAKDSSTLLWSLTIMFLLFCFNAFAILWNRWASLDIIKNVVGNMRRELLAQTMELSRQHYVNEDTDVIHSKIVNDSERIDCMTSALLTQFFPGALIALGLSCFLVYENPLLFLVVVCALPLLYGVGRLVGRKVKKRIQQFHRDFSGFSKGVLFVLKFNELIKLSTAETNELERQEGNIQNLRFSSQRMAWLSTAYTIIQNNILILSGIVVLLAGGLQVVYGITTIGSLLAFYVALNLLSSNAGNVINSIPAIIEGKESLDAVMPLLKKAEDAKKKLDPFKGLNKKILFDNVDFKHDNSNFSMTDVNFEIKKNELFGIFGASGSGKSTIINLLLGFYAPHKGRIVIDDQAIHDIDPIEYRKRIGVLSQDLLIFSGTIRENLTYGLSNVDNKLIEKICLYCNIHEYIKSLKKGYDSEIGERGVKLSGGQKQRIAIARAILRNPEILILDEPDNNLDESMFITILENIRKLPLTIIVISHNKNLYPYFDRVYNLT